MIASLPLTAWLLIIATIVVPLSIELAFLSNHWGERRRRRRAEEAKAEARARPSASETRGGGS